MEEKKYNIEWLEQTASTNDEARNGRYGHGDVIVADRQTAGRGQRDNVWDSEVGKNLTFSVVLEPLFLDADRQFLLSEAVSLAVTDTLLGYGIAADVKWPNDIYIGDRKVAGILIENDITRGVISRSVVGIGLNVNQAGFDPSLPNPISMKLASGSDFGRGEVLHHFLLALSQRYDTLKQTDSTIIEYDYHKRLFRKGVQALYSLPDGSTFMGCIVRVLSSGELVVRHPDGSIRQYLFKEIEYIR